MMTSYAHQLLLVFTAYVIAAGSRAALTVEPGPHAAGMETPSRLALYQRGLFMHLGNPKAVLSWVALMTLGLGADATWHDVATILGGCAILSVAIFCGYALVFSAAPMVRLYQAARRWIEGLLALFFGFAGLRLLFSRA